jgi:hypothetical protein
LDVLHATARDTDDFDRLRTPTGCVDAYGSRTILQPREALVEQQAAIMIRLTEAIATESRQLAEAADATARQPVTAGYPSLGRTPTPMARGSNSDHSTPAKQKRARALRPTSRRDR